MNPSIQVITISKEIIDKVNIEIYGSLEAAAIAEKQEAKLWCKCKEDHNAYYVPDTKNMKHHWSCNRCHKITQIG